MIRDRRAVSTPVAYTLTLSMALVLVSGLLLGGTTMVDDQRQRTMQSQLSTIGQQVTGTYEKVERLANSSSGDPNTVSVTLRLPERIVGNGYAIRERSSNGNIVLVADDMGVSVAFDVGVRARIGNDQVPGGEVTITYNAQPSPTPDEVNIANV